MVTKIYLIRHAEAQGNAEEFFQGSINTDLTEKGRNQLRFLSERFRKVPISAIYSSPLRRAMDTAEAINRYHALTIQQDSQLREIHGGAWEGLPWSELPQKFPTQYAQWTERMWEFQAPGGDAMTDVYQRMRDTLESIAQSNPGRTIAVVSHGCAVRNFLCFTEFGRIEELPNVGWADNTAVSLIEYESEKGFSLVYKNDSSHLPAEYSSLRGAKWAAYETESGEIT